MFGENEDSNVQSYIQTQTTGIACKTLLALQLSESEENGEQHTTAEAGNQSNAKLSISPRGRGLNNVMSYCLENQIWFNGDYN